MILKVANNPVLTPCLGAYLSTDDLEKILDKHVNEILLIPEFDVATAIFSRDNMEYSPNSEQRLAAEWLMSMPTFCPEAWPGCTFLLTKRGTLLGIVPKGVEVTKGGLPFEVVKDFAERYGCKEADSLGPYKTKADFARVMLQVAGATPSGKMDKWGVYLGDQIWYFYPSSGTSKMLLWLFSPESKHFISSWCGQRSTNDSEVVIFTALLMQGENDVFETLDDLPFNAVRDIIDKVGGAL